MKIIIKPVDKRSDEKETLAVWRSVFEREMRVDCSGFRFSRSDSCLHLLARDASTGEPVATMSVEDASRDYDVRERLGLGRDKEIRVARYTRMAVLNGYRGIHIPIVLMLEARERFVRPNLYHFSWLLYDADRAESSSFCRLLGFRPSEETLATPLGRARILIRNEQASDASDEGSNEEYLRRLPRHIPMPGFLQPLYF